MRSIGRVYKLHVANWPRVQITRGQLFLRRIWPRGQQNTQPSGHVSTVTGTVDTRRFSVFFVVVQDSHYFLLWVRFKVCISNGIGIGDVTVDTYLKKFK
jgi:hypothetical protein